MTKYRANLTAPRHAQPATAATFGDLTAGLAEAGKKARDAVSARAAGSINHGAVLGRSAALSALAVATVGAPVNAMLQPEDGTRGADASEIQSVIISTDGSFQMEDPAEGVVAALDVETLADARSGVSSSRSGRDELPAATEPEQSPSGDVHSEAPAAEAPASEAPAEDQPAAAEPEAEPSAPAPAVEDPALAENAAPADESAPVAVEGPAPAEAATPVDVADETAATSGEDAIGEPSAEGGIPVAGGDAGTDVPDTELNAAAQSSEPVLAAHEAAVWVANEQILEGIGVITASANSDREEILEQARQVLADTEGEVSDEANRTNVADAITALEQAVDSASVEGAVSHLAELVEVLEEDHAETTGTTAMVEASAAARAAIARGRAYDPPASLNFGSNGEFVMPVPNGRFTSAYGPRWGGFHNGIDLAAPAGSPIRVAADGVVTYVGYGHTSRGLTGWVVIVSHGNGLETSYNHMYSDGVLVEEGQAVVAGEQIAEVGSTGRSTGPHLHLAVWQNGSTVNPVTFFAGRGVSLR